MDIPSAKVLTIRYNDLRPIDTPQLLINSNRNRSISATSHSGHRGNSCAWCLTLEVATCGAMPQALHSALRLTTFAVSPVHTILNLRQHIPMSHPTSTFRTPTRLAQPEIMYPILSTLEGSQ